MTKSYDLPESGGDTLIVSVGRNVGTAGAILPDDVWKRFQTAVRRAVKGSGDYLTVFFEGTGKGVNTGTRANRLPAVVEESFTVIAARPNGDKIPSAIVRAIRAALARTAKTYDQREIALTLGFGEAVEAVKDGE